MSEVQNIRERSEKEEEERLSPFAAKSRDAKRERWEEECPIRTKFQRDRDRILHSKPFRRLKHKTQVYIAPSGDHYRTRMTHSLEVSQICRTIARGLQLNEDLIEAIALGHDVGHTPFGHVGEEALRRIISHFEHNEQSIRILKVLAREGQGLNLTEPVLDGILHHTGDGIPKTLEGQIVKTGDRIAYLCHDYDDALRAGLLHQRDLPEIVKRTLGEKPSDMITTMVVDMIEASNEQNHIEQTVEVGVQCTNLGSLCLPGYITAQPCVRNDGKGNILFRPFLIIIARIYLNCLRILWSGPTETKLKWLLTTYQGSQIIMQLICFRDCLFLDKPFAQKQKEKVVES